MKSSLRWPYWAMIVLSALYFTLFGVLSLAWHADGDDLLIFHQAGSAALQGLNPYTPGRFSDPFPYPPAWLPFCELLSLMPAQVAVWVWKLLNILFLAGSVHLSLKLMFGERKPSSAQLTAVWCFSFLLWPTSIAVFDGNTPLCVLFFALLGFYLSQRGHICGAGVCLGFSLIKPNVVLPLFALLFAQAKWRLLFVALVVAVVLTVWGVYLSGISLGEYFSVLKVYNATNAVTDSSSVGFAKLVAIASGVDSEKARLVAAGVGAIAVLTFAALRYFPARAIADLQPDPMLAAFLLVGIGFLGARGYDLVFVIPVFVWLISLPSTYRWLTWPALLLAASFILPQRAIELAYERVLSKILPLPVFDYLLSPFRSWALLGLLLLSILLFLQIKRARINSTQVHPMFNAD